MPFIKKLHPEGNFVFWPDLASAHYAKSVTSYLISKNITFVQKADNPPAVPELRLVENFWSILKGMVYKNNRQATSVDELKQRVKYCLKKVDVNAVQNMFGGVYQKLDFETVKQVATSKINYLIINLRIVFYFIKKY